MCYLLKYLFHSSRGSVLRYYFYTLVTKAILLTCDIKETGRNKFAWILRIGRDYTEIPVVKDEGHQL